MINESIERILNLIATLPETANPIESEKELINLVRSFGAGGKGFRGELYDKIRAEFEQKPELKARIVELSKSEFPKTRSWTGSFIEQLFPPAEATKVLLQMLEVEKESNAASWLCLNLARLNRNGSNIKVCKQIGLSYERFAGFEPARLQIARAWGYAGCKEALIPLRDYLIQGGYDQVSVSLDGLIGCCLIIDKSTIEALWHVLLITPYLDIKTKAASILMHVDQRYILDTIRRFIELMSNPKENLEIQKISIDALLTFRFNDHIASNVKDILIELVLYAHREIIPQLIKILNELYKDWVKIIIEKVIQIDKPEYLNKIAYALSTDEHSRHEAVSHLNNYINTDDEKIQNRATSLLKEIGGSEAFETLYSILNTRYIEPSDKLQDISSKVFQETIIRMKKNYGTTVTMNTVVFVIGVIVILMGVVLIIFDRANLLFGTVGVISGLGTLVSLFFLGSIKRVQKSLTEIVQVEVAYLSFMHRILQARSIFESQYLAEKITLESLLIFDKLLHDNMQSTMELLELYCDVIKTSNKKP